MTDFNPGYLLNAVVYAMLGIVLFAAAVSALGRMTPYDVWKEICEKQNVALAIVVGAVSLGLSIIIAAAVH